MDLSSLPAEVLFSLLAILIVAGVGCGAALQSWIRISNEKKAVKQADILLLGDGAWNDAYPHDKLQLAIWLRGKGIKPDSHLGDFIRTSWSAWLGGRPASLTELHVLVARRERAYRSTRLSAGIAALLLVLGIIGTLSSIKPVLRDFKFNIATETSSEPVKEGDQEPIGGSPFPEDSETENDGASVAANTELVNTLIHNLGNAFWPSLLALVGTICVVSCRGLYSLTLHKFILDLDSFAVDTLIPRYRVPSLSEQYQEVKVTLARVTESLLQREGRFHEAVDKLENLVGGITPALGGLDIAASATNQAANALSSRAQSITDGLTRHLGAKSPIHRAVAGLGAIFEKTEESLGNLSSVVDAIGQATTSSQQELKSSIQALDLSVGKIARDHQSNQLDAKAALDDFKEVLGGIPKEIQTTSGKAIDTSMAAVKSGVVALHEEQKKWHIDSSEELKKATVSGLAGVTTTAQDLIAQAERIAAAVTDISNIKDDARASFEELEIAGKTQISQAGEAAKSKIEKTSGKLESEAEKIALEIDRLSKIQIPEDRKPPSIMDRFRNRNS
jgi:hypothetical protein